MSPSGIETGNGALHPGLTSIHSLARWALMSLAKLLLLADAGEPNSAGRNEGPSTATQIAMLSSNRNKLLTIVNAIVDSRIKCHHGRTTRAIRNSRTAPRDACAKRVPQREQKLAWSVVLWPHREHVIRCAPVIFACQFQ